MKTSTPRPHRKPAYAPVKTIDIFKQARPSSVASMGYCMSVASPLIDPCAYASSVSGPNQNNRPAHRITECLKPTYEETEAESGRYNGSNRLSRSSAGDPLLELEKKHDIRGFKESMEVVGVPVEQYQARQPSHSREIVTPRTITSNGGDVTIMGDTSETIMSTTTMLVTPVRRALQAPQGSTAKRQRTMNSNEGDISSDTVRSVLRLVDESLLDTPERKAVVTPRVLKAVPGPSPREQGPTYAYASGTRAEKYGGLFPRTSMILSPFSVTRV